MKTVLVLALACALAGPVRADDPAPVPAAAPAPVEAPPKRITAWPLFYRTADAQSAETDILWPLLHYERNDSYERYAFRPFIFSTEHDPAKDFRKTSVLWPLSIREHTPEQDWFHVFPVYWDVTARDYSVWALWPLYGRYTRGDYTERSTLWPLFAYGSDSSGREVSHRALPFYWVDRTPDTSAGFVLPYFWSTTADSDTHGLFPLWFSREAGAEDLTLVLPVYLGYDNADVGIRLGLPLYARYTSPETRFTVVLPVYWHSLDTARDAEFTYGFPLYGTYRRGTSTSAHYLLFPLYSRLKDREQQLEAWDVVWPLFHYETSPDTLDLRVLPLFWRSRTPGHAWTFSLLSGSMQSGDQERGWIVPFYYHSADAASSLTVGTLALLPPYYVDWQEPGLARFHVWPFYGHDHEPAWDEYSTFWPLFRFGASPDVRDSLTEVLAYYRERRGDASSVGVLPLWYHQSSPSQVTDLGLFLYWYRDQPPAQKTSWSFLWILPPELSVVRYEHAPAYRRNAVFPLYGYERDDARDATKWSVLWPVVIYEKDATTRDFRFLWRFVRRSEAPDSSIFEFNPFYYHEVAPGKGDYWNVLGGLVGRRTGADGKSEMQWLWFF